MNSKKADRMLIEVKMALKQELKKLAAHLNEDPNCPVLIELAEKLHRLIGEIKS